MTHVRTVTPEEVLWWLKYRGELHMHRYPRGDTRKGRDYFRWVYVTDVSGAFCKRAPDRCVRIRLVGRMLELMPPSRA